MPKELEQLDTSGTFILRSLCHASAPVLAGTIGNTGGGGGGNKQKNKQKNNPKNNPLRNMIKDYRRVAVQIEQ